MKLLLAFCLLAALWVMPGAAQTEKPAEGTGGQDPANRPTAVVPMREDERISFMEEGGNSAYASSSAPSAGGLIVRTLGALCLVGGLIFGAAWGLKKFGGYKFGKAPGDAADAAAAAAELIVLSSVTLGANRTLSVVRFGEKTLLVGSTPQTIALLATEDSAVKNAAAAAAQPRSVAEMLAEDDDDISLEDDAHDEFSFDATLAEIEESLREDLRAAGRSKSV